MKIVCDTNVLVSGILFEQGYPRQILVLISNGTITNFMSPSLYFSQKMKKYYVVQNFNPK